jgi:elongation factor G
MMKEFQSSDIRNFALVGHGASGKTMLSESMLSCGGVVNRLGTIINGNTVSDYHEDERERKISIHASLLHTEWKNKKFNILDTPGYADFIGEAISALRVADFAAVVVHAGHGVEVGTEQVWEYATDYNIPKMLILNALDKENLNLNEVMEQIKERFGNKVFAMTLPVKVGPGFNQVVDVLAKKLITYQTDGSGKYTEEELSGEWKEKVDALHEELIELVAESDDSLLEKFFEQGGLSEEEMRDGIHAAVQGESIIPLFSTSGETNVGVSHAMDFIAKYGSSPVDRKEVKGINEKGEETTIALDNKESVAFVFKTMSEPQIGELSFFRLYSGTVAPGMTLFNSSRRRDERFGQMFSLNGKNRDAVTVLHAGDIGAVVKLKDTHTNNTLCDHKKVVALAKIEYPKPNIHSAIKPRAKGDEEKMGIGLAAIHEEDPTFIFKGDPELHQMVISGQGELHLTVIINRLKSKYKIDIDVSEPKIPYRETIKANSEAKYRHRKQSGGAGQFAEVWMRIAPLSKKDDDIEFTQSLSGQNVDRVFVPSVEKGVKTACTQGALAGYKVMGVKVDFYDGKQHPVDSKDIAFQIAGKFAFRDAFLNAKPCLLEPIMNLTVKVPDEFMGDIMGGISGKRGKISGVDAEGKFQVIKALVPQAELYKYSTILRSITGGRGIHSEEFSHYEEMPRETEIRVVEQHKKEREAQH